MERQRYHPDNSPEARRGRVALLAELFEYKTPTVKELPPRPPKHVLRLITTPLPDFEPPQSDALAA